MATWVPYKLTTADFKFETKQLVDGADTIQRQVIVIADPITLDSYARTAATTPGVGDRGLIVRPIPVAASFTVTVTTVGTTRVQLSGSSVPTPNGIWIKSHEDNSGDVVILHSDAGAVATHGWFLSTGQEFPGRLMIDNANKVWILGSAAGQQVRWVAA